MPPNLFKPNSSKAKAIGIKPPSINEEYINVIENCSYWEAYYIVTVIWNERVDKYEKAKEVYNNCKEKLLKGE